MSPTPAVFTRIRFTIPNSTKGTKPAHEGRRPTSAANSNAERSKWLPVCPTALHREPNLAIPATQSNDSSVAPVAQAWPNTQTNQPIPRGTHHPSAVWAISPPITRRRPLQTPSHRDGPVHFVISLALNLALMGLM